MHFFYVCRWIARCFCIGKLVPSSAVITRSDMIWFCIHRCGYRDITEIRVWPHKRHPILRPTGRAFWCLLLRLLMAPHCICEAHTSRKQSWQIYKSFIWKFVFTSPLHILFDGTEKIISWNIPTEYWAQVQIGYFALKWDNWQIRQQILNKWHKFRNTMRPNHEYMRRQTRHSYLQTMACRLLSPLSRPMVVYC